LTVRLAPAQAQSFEEAVKSCATVTDNQRRLACYDGAVRMEPKSATTPAAPAAAASATAASPGASGVTVPPSPAGSSVAPAAAAGGASTASAGEFGVRNGPLDVRKSATGPKEIMAVVTGIQPRADGALLFQLDNGQSWLENQPNDLGLKTGDTVRIRTAALGSYMLYASSNRFTHVTRVH
jgi:hypothetical protein